MLHSPNVHQLFILTWYIEVTWWSVSLAYISRLGPVLGRNVKSILQYLEVLHSPNLHLLFILTWSTDVTRCFVPWPTFHVWLAMVRKKWVKSIFGVSCLDLHFTFDWPWLGRNELSLYLIQYLRVLHSPNLHQLFTLTLSTNGNYKQLVVCVLNL